MKKLLVLSLVVVAAVACGKKGNKQTEAQKQEAQIEADFKAHGRFVTKEDLTANRWCGMTETADEPSVNLLFKEDDTVEIVAISIVDGKPQAQPTETVPYKVSNGTVTLGSGSSDSARVQVLVDEEASYLRVKSSDEPESALYISCSQN